MGEISYAPAFAIGVNEILLIIGVLLILVGIALAFRGRRIWGGLMSIIGAVIGGALGYIFGMMLNNWIIALILSMVGAFIGSLLFGYIVKVALALVTALLISGLAYIAMGPGISQDLKIILAAILLIVVYAIAYWFIQEIIAFVTAALGGILVGVGIVLVGLDLTAALAVGGLVFLAGFIIQTVDYRKEKKRKQAQAAAASSSSYYLYQEPYQSPPPPPPP